MKKPPVKKIVPPAPVIIHDPENRQMLEDLHLNHHQHAERAHVDAEHHLMQSKRNGDALEASVEAHGRTIDGIKNLHKGVDDMHEGMTEKLDEVTGKLDEVGDKIVEGLKPPEIQKVMIVMPDRNEEDDKQDDESLDEEDQETKVGKKLFDLLRGRRGPKGDSRTDEEMFALIAQVVDPLIPDIAKEAKHSKEELETLIKSLLPKDDEEMDDTRIMELIQKVVPQMIPSDEKIKKFIAEVMPENDAPTLEEILAFVKNKISYNDIKDKPNLETFRSRMAGTGYLREISDVNVSNIRSTQGLQWDKTTNKWIPGVSIVVSTTAPQDPVEGDLWVDTN